ncbi:hypothetical protein Nepgr_033931 [Nepenthes gracilis]|uniref:Uncharacterized protein n=1 Tax=Nepenthes gracilis TaxID=150966 RepID=A0AAD3TN61_NEPGR|nr:hypothetical protein Nepgr_033931 [Nepenthes gracilis]
MLSVGICPAGCATEAFWTLYAADLVIKGCCLCVRLLLFCLDRLDGFSGNSQLLAIVQLACLVQIRVILMDSDFAVFVMMLNCCHLDVRRVQVDFALFCVLAGEVKTIADLVSRAGLGSKCCRSQNRDRFGLLPGFFRAWEPGLGASRFSSTYSDDGAGLLNC